MTDKPKPLTLKKPLSLEQQAKIVMTFGHIKTQNNQDEQPPLPKNTQTKSNDSSKGNPSKPKKEQGTAINTDQGHKEDQKHKPSQKQLEAAEKAAKRQRQQERKQRIQEALSWLKATFPACFDITPLLPLKVGIGKDVMSYLDTCDHTDQPSRLAIRQALGYYTKGRQYHEAVIAATHRCDLTGALDQEITEQAKDYARSQIVFLEDQYRLRQERFQKYQEKRQQKKANSEATKVDEPTETVSDIQSEESSS